MFQFKQKETTMFFLNSPNSKENTTTIRILLTNRSQVKHATSFVLTKCFSTEYYTWFRFVFLCEIWLISSRALIMSRQYFPPSSRVDKTLFFWEITQRESTWINRKRNIYCEKEKASCYQSCKLLIKKLFRLRTSSLISIEKNEPNRFPFDLEIYYRQFLVHHP